MQVYKDKKDLYAVIASKIFKKDYWECMEHYEDGTPNPDGKALRSKGKQLVLATLYGMGPKLMGEFLGISIEESKQILDEFFKMFPDVKTFTRQNEIDAKEKGFVEDYLGRIRHLPDAQLPELNIYATKDLYIDKDVFLDSNQIEDKVTLIDESNTAKWKNIYDTKYKDKGFAAKVTFKDIAKNNGINVQDNGAFISKALTQCTNSRVQGCLSGDTFIQTKELGIKKIRDIVGKCVHIWDGNDWTTCDIVSTGKKQKCIITFTNGQRFICSPNHLFMVMGTNSKVYWKRCDELKFNHKIKIVENFLNSDYVYKTSKDININHAHNANLYYLDDIADSYYRGQFLGRLASDGSYNLGSFTLLFAEHEYNILDKFKNLPYKCTIKSHLRENRNQEITTISCYSKLLLNEINELDIKHILSDKILEDTQTLRGFISGFFDGDGGVNGGHICLTFGTQYNFEQLIRDLQKALCVIGIRSRYRKYAGCYRLIIYKYDNTVFANRIGFINSKKQKLAKLAKTAKIEKIFGNVLTVKDVKITDEYIDMYDILNTERGYYAADGLIVHNSSATLTKKAMINIDKSDNLNKIGFRLLIPIHDELLGECPIVYVDEAEQYLSKAMISAAEKPECIIDMKVDTYVVSNWYLDEITNKIYDKYIKFCEDLPSESAIKLLYEEYPELSHNLIDKVCNKTYDLLSGEL